MDTQEFFPLEERIMIEETSNLYPCDLCDQVNHPHVSWHCTHDDPAHVTTVCLECLEKVGFLVNHKDFEEKRTDPYQETF